MKINDKVKMLTNEEPCWKQGDIGCITSIYVSDDGIVYLICFDNDCHNRHTMNNEHSYWVRERFFESLQATLIKAE
jgi:hypothetical protein